MKSKMMVKLACDGVMTLLLLLLMAYEMVGEAVHEWLAAALMLSSLLHHILNADWSKKIFKGAYSPFRLFQNLTAAAIFVCMLGLAGSGVILSRHVFAFLPVGGGRSTARTVHMLCSYWGFILMGVHLGLHFDMLMSIISRAAAQRKLSPIAGATIAVYGVYAFIKRELWAYMLLRSHFVFFDYDEPLFFFLLDYASIMAVSVTAGRLAAKFLRRKRAGSKTCR